MKTGCWTTLLCLVVLASFAPARAQGLSEEILAPLLKSAEDWNRGDLDGFMQSYEQSPETTFVGSEVARGTDAVLSRYKRSYPDAARMGKITFSELQTRPLSADLAIVTGRFHLERGQERGGNMSGIFTLVMRRGANGWRIIHDHTSADN
jgi:uncharacterized protein (TIGR02246 family)